MPVAVESDMVVVCGRLKLSKAVEAGKCDVGQANCSRSVYQARPPCQDFSATARYRSHDSRDARDVVGAVVVVCLRPNLPSYAEYF